MNYCPKFTVIIPVYNVAAYLLFKRKYQYSWQSCMYWIIESVNVIKKE